MAMTDFRQGGCTLGEASELSPQDAEVVRDFQRFLAVVERVGAMWVVPNWRWRAYALGEMGAPPLMWEGDNA